MIRPHRLAFLAMLTAALLLIAAPVLACGGFFCSQVPVEQRGEQIVFAYGPGEKVTAIIQIAYQGSAEDFAWVVPVTGEPDIALGPDAIFSTLRMRTDPQFWLNWDYDGNSECAMWPESAMADGGSDPNAGGEVVVLDKQVVGPFIAVTLSASGDEAASVLLQWLDDNDFDQPDESLPLIDHYLGLGMNFVAVKLKENAVTGDLQPLMLTMDGTGPCIPLVLTRIAAAPDMPVTAWVFGEARVVPTNWFGVEINPKKIDWVRNGINYAGAATAAIDDAAGHGFITEYAQTMWTDGLLHTEGQFDTGALAVITDPAAFLQELLMQGFPRNAQMQSLIREFIPKPEESELSEQCKTDQQFYTWNLESCLAEMPSDWVFDAVAFAAALEEKVVGPMMSGQMILDRVADTDEDGDDVPDSSYLTRLFTTVSPEEMTRDPMFAFNRELGDVDNYHTAQAVAVCDEVDPQLIASATITYGEETWTVEGPFELWNNTVGEFTDPAPEETASDGIVVFSTEGPAQAVYLNEDACPEPSADGTTPLCLTVAEQEQTFQLMDPTHLPIEELPVDQTPDDNTGGGDIPTDNGGSNAPPASSNGGGCGVAGGTSSLALLSGLLIGLCVLRRRQTYPL